MISRLVQAVIFDCISASEKIGESCPPPPPLQNNVLNLQTLDNNGVLTEETTSTSQAKDERTEDEGDGGLETKITAQVRAIILYTCSVYYIDCYIVCDIFMWYILYPKLTAAFAVSPLSLIVSILCL